MAAERSIFIRREIWGLAADDPIVTWYARAVAIMRERSDSDPAGWSYQAAIHGTHAKESRPQWNECQHGTWFFLPWHRMFLYHFEQIARAAIVAAGGPGDWALPYWNYGLGGQNATLPLAFRSPTLADGSQNALYIAERAGGINTGGSLSPSAISPAAALGRPAFIGTAEFGGDRTAPAQFSKSGGELEETPHNVVHDQVGRGGLMGDIRTAAQDPIFWLHHANIDRIWTVWREAPGHSDPTEPQWLNQSFTFFDTNGHAVTMECDRVLATIPDLGYTYDTITPPPPAPPPPAARPAAEAPAPAPPVLSAARATSTDTLRRPERQMVGASTEGVELVGEPARLLVPIDPGAAHPLAPNQHVYLNVEDIEGERNPGTPYGVYAHRPGAAPSDQETATHVGNISFFGIERAREPAGDEPAHNLRSSFDVTHLAHELEAQDAWGGHSLALTFRPLTLTPPETPDENDTVEPPAHPDSPIHIGRVSLFYDA